MHPGIRVQVGDLCGLGGAKDFVGHPLGVEQRDVEIRLDHDSGLLVNTEDAVQPIDTKPPDNGHHDDGQQQPHAFHGAANRNHPHPRVPPIART